MTRNGYKLYCKTKSRKKNSKPKTEKELRKLIRQMVIYNPPGRVPRIHDEILKLGYKVSQSTLLRYMPEGNGRTIEQRWEIYFKNYSKEIISFDFFTVSPINF